MFLLYLAGTVTSTMAGRLADRRGRALVLGGALPITVIGLLVTVPHALVAIVVGTGVFTGGFFAAHTVASGWVGAVAHRDRAEASSLYLFSYYLGASVARRFRRACLQPRRLAGRRHVRGHAAVSRPVAGGAVDERDCARTGLRQRNCGMTSSANSSRCARSDRSSSWAYTRCRPMSFQGTQFVDDLGGRCRPAGCWTASRPGRGRSPPRGGRLRSHRGPHKQRTRPSTRWSRPVCRPRRPPRPPARTGSSRCLAARTGC